MEEKIIVKKPPKSSFMAGFLSLFPGGGTIYNGQTAKGLIYMVMFAVLVTWVSTTNDNGPFPGLILAGFIVFQFIEAILVAKAINRKALLGEDVEEMTVEEVPQFVKSGSIFWGIVLMALGGILILANFDVISYDTLFDFWPVVVIAIGIKFILDYMAKNK
jgi:hypothetical protein